MSKPILPHNNHPIAHVLPSSPYGISATRYMDTENPLLPLPQRNVMTAANKLNEYRYRKLSEKQRVFIDVYLASEFNAAEAAKKSGYCSHVPNDDRYEKVCGSIGRKLAKSKHIAIGIQLACEYHAARSQIQTVDVINEIRNIAFSNMGDYFVNDGTGDPRLQMPEDHERAKLSALSEITVESYDEGRGDNKREVKRIKIKAHDKLAALEKLLRIAIAKGDPAVAGMSEHNNVGGNTVNVFNILPITSGEFLPAPEQPEARFKLPEYQAPVPNEPALLSETTSSVPVRTILPAATQEPLQWSQPEKAQRRPLTIDHEAAE